MKTKEQIYDEIIEWYKKADEMTFICTKDLEGLRDYVFNKLNSRKE